MSREEKFSTRRFIIVHRADLSNEIIKPESVLLQLKASGNAKPIDIGSWCYTKRLKRVTGWNTNLRVQTLPVVLRSFRKDRRELVARFLDWVAVCGLRDDSVNSELQYMTRALDWADTNNHSEFLTNEESAVAAFRDYTDSLAHKMHIENVSPNSLTRNQKGMRNLIGLLYPELVPRVRASTFNFKETKIAVSAPEKEHVLEYLSYLVPFMRNLRSVVMNDDFPFRIKDGKCDISIYPLQSCNVFNRNFASEKKRTILSVYDLTDDSILSFENYFKESKKINPNLTFSSARRGYNEALASLEMENANKHEGYFRAQWAQKVIRCYASILQMITGMNPTQLVALKYSDVATLHRGMVSRDIRTIKFRASGREEVYPLGGGKGVAILREYLGFREWYLNGQETDLLFFTNIKGNVRLKCEPTSLRLDFQSRLYRQLKGKVFPTRLENITPSAARKNKSLVLKSLGVSRKDVSDMLNHTEDVNEQSYSKPNIDQSKRELGNYWSSVRKIANQIKVKKTKLNDPSLNITVGHCESFGNPASLESGPSIEPNCRTQYGCLFCKHYACHADEEDIRKLICLKYVAEAVKSGADDVKAVDGLFKELTFRIDVILDRILNLYPEMSENLIQIEREVFELGILTKFWEKRLSRYEELGVVI